MSLNKVTELKAELGIERDALRVRGEGLGAYLITRKKGVPGMSHTGVRFSGKDIMNAVFHMLNRIKGADVPPGVVEHITIARRELVEAINIANRD